MAAIDKRSAYECIADEMQLARSRIAAFGTTPSEREMRYLMIQFLELGEQIVRCRGSREIPSERKAA